MYITEAPIHVGLLLVPFCILFIIVILGLNVVVRRTDTNRIGSILFLLTFLSVFLVYLTFMLSIVLLPSGASAQQLLPYYQWTGVFLCLHLLFGMYYTKGSTSWGIDKGPLWAPLMPTLFVVGFIALLFLGLPNSHLSVINDGTMNFLVLPSYLVSYGIILCLVFLLGIDTYVVFKVNLARLTGAEQFWARIYWVSDQMWLITLILGMLLQFFASLILWIFGFSAITWIVLSFSMMKYEQAYFQRISESETDG